MDELLLEILGGTGVLASGFFYTKFQTAQNHKEIQVLLKGKCRKRKNGCNKRH